MIYQPALDRASTQQIEAFRRLFLKDAESLCISFNDEPVETLHSKRSELRKLAKGILDNTSKEKRALTSDEKDAFDLISYIHEDIQYGFDLRSMKDQATRSINGVTGISTRSLETWQDVTTGKAVPVLGKDHLFRDHFNRNGNNVSARDYFSAIAGNTVSPEVRTALSTGNDTSGGFLVPEYIAAELIDLMRAKSVISQTDCRTIPLPAQTCRVCRITSDPEASWVGENNLIPEDSSMEIGALDFHAKKLTCLIKASTELLQDASNAGTTIMNAMATAMATSLDSAALMGTGAGEPLGIFNAEGINVYSLGDNGNELSGYDDLLYGVREIINANGPVPATAIMSPRTLIGYSLLKDGEGKPLVKPELIKNMQFLETTKIPVNQVQGTSGAVCSSIIMGGFNQLVIGIRSVLEVQVLRERYAEFGQIGFLCTMRADTAIYQPKAFCKVIGIK